MNVRALSNFCVGAVLLACLGCGALPFGSGGTDGPVIYGGSSNDGEDAQVGGVVTLDGECLYLQFVDDPSLRYPVVWPRGSRWQEAPPGVVLPNGDIAALGDTVAGGGGYHNPEYVATIASEAGAVLANQCADGQFREVAIFNAGDDVDVEGAPFADPELAGLCEDTIFDFAEDEPASSATERAAVTQFIAETQILTGLVVQDGAIEFRGQQVGTYQVVARPEGTFAVESAEWCYPEE